MKNLGATIIYGLIIVLTSVSFSQEIKKQKAEKTKEVKMEIENGKKLLTIITTENGKVTEEVFEGDAAELKMAELEGKINFKEESQKIKLEDVDGKKKLTIVTTKAGKKTEEVFVGDEAEKKIKEIGLQESKMIEVEKKEVKEK
tara:strand:+ start:13915 stop:14346 length:432 start_codon:yes stop_codon:yes gene_type:complete